MTALPATPPGARETHSLNRTVIGAGVTSALGDFCYETTTVMPLARFSVRYWLIHVDERRHCIGRSGMMWTAFSPTLGFGLAALLMAAGTLALFRVGREQQLP